MRTVWKFSYPNANFTSDNNSGTYPHLINFINTSVQGTHPIQQWSGALEMKSSIPMGVLIIVLSIQASLI